MNNGLQDRLEIDVFNTGTETPMTSLRPSLVLAHCEFLESLPALIDLIDDVVAGNRQLPEAASLSLKATELGEQLRWLFEREEENLFPALIKLETQFRISPCRAGMVGARVRCMMREQERVLEIVIEMQRLATQHLSPAGPCESCHNLLAMLSDLRLDLEQHLRLERERLFNWALAREAMLTAPLNY
jgi:iron-sulfur cluster repair protein YtfE (RIC family)